MWYYLLGCCITWYSWLTLFSSSISGEFSAALTTHGQLILQLPKSNFIFRFYRDEERVSQDYFLHKFVIIFHFNVFIFLPIFRSHKAQSVSCERSPSAVHFIVLQEKYQMERMLMGLHENNFQAIHFVFGMWKHKTKPLQKGTAKCVPLNCFQQMYFHELHDINQHSRQL